MANQKFGIIYQDPNLQLERYSSVGKAQKRFNELAETAVDNLMFIIIVEEAKT